MIKFSNSRIGGHIAARIKSALVRLGADGYLPATMVTWIIRHGGLRNA